MKVGNSNLNGTYKRENTTERHNSQDTPLTRSHNGAVRKQKIETEFFQKPRGGNASKSIFSNTKNKSKSTRMFVPKVTEQRIWNSLAETAGWSENEEFANRSRVSVSQNVRELGNDDI